MKFVFFDIECAGVHKNYAKICAFGYVICDEKFKILEKEDMLINPRGKFELTDRKGEKGIILPYEYEDFKKYPSFPEVYKRIKVLLEDKNAYVLGHSVLNDVKYLKLETQRFRLPSFDFRFSDSQLLYMTHINDFSHQFGLEHIAESLNVEFTPHRAVDDAYATMRVVEELCKAHSCNYEELTKKLCVTSGRIVNYSITKPQTQGLKRFNVEKRRAKEERSLKRIKFNEYFSKKKYTKCGKLKGRFFTFSRAIEDDLDTSLNLVDRIYSLGGRYTQQMEICNVFVKTENDDSGRYKRANSDDKLEVISIEELERLLND